MPKSLFNSRLAAIAAALLLAACGGDDGGTKPATQVAAKVNSEEISVHQINGALSRVANIKPDQLKQASTGILERLIDQELLVQQANEKKLDRDPRVLQLIEASRREILARAYLDQTLAQTGKPTDAEVKTFYDEHPDLFAKRRIYNLQELNIRLPAERQDELRAQVDQARNFPELINWLRAQNIPFAAGGGVKPAEQLPLEALPRFAAMKDGQIALVRGPEGVIVMFLAASREQPLDENQARPFIEKFLENRARTELAKAEIKRLRDAAKIEYVGEFTKPAEPAAVATDPAAPAPDAPLVADPAAAPAVEAPAAAAHSDAPAAPITPAAAAAEEASQTAIEKGVAGLK
ncbi:MAG: peptidyl-prolyl cis-trans isomerase, EpsD family [Zoogloeaceae bacterium]|nr:peptidyl-prolyl cis-trans isomerase, EpsD family [Zoogloeaceae bacterium]MCW5616829.1 EpsD family peptidyl-prolyl cis-trans isomerase [Rhodocyclaceae bacterium]